MKSAWNHSAATWRLPLAALAAACALAACDVTSADFSAYTGVNLIPDGGFEAWTPDQDIGAAPGNIYMDFRRLDTAAAASFAGDTGFADSAALYAGLPDSANTAAGARPAVYRLEIKNLFKDGDFEESTVAATSAAGPIGTNVNRFEGVISTDPGTRNRAIVATSSLGRGKALLVEQPANDTTSIDLSINTHIWASSANYNLSFKAYYGDNNSTVISFGNSTSDIIIFTIPTKQIDPIVRYPQSFSRSTPSFFSGTDGSILSIHPFIGNLGGRYQASNKTFDDFQLVNTDKTYAVRFEVPLATAATKADGSKLRLVQGGTYTFSVWVRQDPTTIWSDAAPNANRRLNAYPADKISLALTDSPGSSTDYWVGRTTVFDAPADSAWTKLSIDVSGLFSNSGAFAAATETTKMLQLIVTPTSTLNNSTQFPGSILVAAPRLEFRATR